LAIFLFRGYNRGMTLHDLPTIVGDNAVHALSAAGINAKVVQVIVTGSGTVRLGGISTVSSSRGLPLPTGSAQFLPYTGNIEWWNLAQLAVYVPTGASVDVVYGL
jgi:hypothetical protein